MGCRASCLAGSSSRSAFRSSFQAANIEQAHAVRHDHDSLLACEACEHAAYRLDSKTEEIADVLARHGQRNMNGRARYPRPALEQPYEEGGEFLVGTAAAQDH